MNLKVILRGKFSDMVHCPVKEVHVVVVKRGGNPVECIYYVGIYHFQFKICPFFQMSEKRLQK